MRERLVARAYLLAWKVVCRVPRRLAELAFRLVADWVWWRRGRSVLQLEANLGRVVAWSQRQAAPATSVTDLKELSLRGMRSYLRYWLEVFRLPAIPDAEILGRMRSTGEEETAFRTMAAGRGVIFALPHMGNWEHAGAWIVLLPRAAPEVCRLGTPCEGTQTRCAGWIGGRPAHSARPMNGGRDGRRRLAAGR